MTFFTFALILTSILASEYDRKISIDWGPIPGAESYEVEWFDSSSCGKGKGQIQKTSDPRWETELPAGRYCMRVRALDTADQPGEWSSLEPFLVKPKPPVEVRRPSVRQLEWDQVPYASGYRVEIIGKNGTVVHSEELKTSSFTLPKKLYRDRQRIDERFEVRVQTLVQGVPPSIGSESRFDVKRDNTLKPRERTLPPQPKPIAIAIEDAVERFSLSREKLVLPSSGLWVNAATTEEKESLKRRTIAASRLELLEEQEESAPSDARIGFAAVAGSQYYHGKDDAGFGARHGEKRGLGLKTRVTARINEERPSGRIAEFEIGSVSMNEDTSLHSAALRLGNEYHFGLDSLNHSVFWLGYGIGWLQVPWASFTSEPPIIIPLSMFAAHISFGFRARVSGKLAVDLSARAEAGPPFQVMGQERRAAPLGARVQAGLLWQLSKDWDVRTGLELEAQKALGSGLLAQTILLGAHAGATYRVGIANERDPEGENALALDSEKLWKLRLAFPISAKTTFSSYRETSDISIRKDTLDGFGVAIDLEATRVFSRQGTGAVFAGITGSKTKNHLRIGYISESIIVDRMDMVGHWALGIGHWNLNGATTDAPAIASSGGLFRLGFTKALGSRLIGEARAQLGIPLALFSSVWQAELGGGYRLSDQFTAWAGFCYERLRLTGKDPDSGLPQSIDQTEQQIRLGIGFQF